MASLCSAKSRSLLTLRKRWNSRPRKRLPACRSPKPSWCAIIQNGRGARALFAEGRLGDVRAIQTIFSYYLDDPRNVCNQADIDGGALLDVACYAVNTAVSYSAPSRCGQSPSWRRIVPSARTG